MTDLQLIICAAVVAFAIELKQYMRREFSAFLCSFLSREISNGLQI